MFSLTYELMKNNQKLILKTAIIVTQMIQSVLLKNI